MPDTGRDHLIFENANTTRIHQDNLRWTIAGSYVALLGAATTVYHEGMIPVALKPYFIPGLFVVGNLFLIILSVESWYYNVFGAYVSDCEERFVSSQPLQPVRLFRESVAARTTPFHPSFIFVLLFVAGTNAAFLTLWLNSMETNPIVRWLIVIVYLSTLVVGCRYWNRIIYKPIVRTLEHWLSPRH